jgi:ADP-heptose:LPS heptosyltransferase
VPKILLIQISTISEIVMASPVLRCIKKQLKEVELHVLTGDSIKEHHLLNPYVNHFIYWEEQFDVMIGKLKNEGYDYIIDLDRNYRSFFIKKALKKRAMTVRKWRVEKFLLNHFNINIMPGIHYTQSCLDVLVPLGIKDDGQGLDYFIPENDRVKETDLPHSHLGGFISFVIEASNNTQKLPLHLLKELCKKIEHPVILLGNKNEAATGDTIAELDSIKIYNACGKFNLNEMADLLRQSKLVISFDSDLQKIAYALKKPVIAVWGATTPVLGTGPYYGNSMKEKMNDENIYLNLGCQPCSNSGTKKCPLKHFNCMEKQDINVLLDKVYLHLKKRAVND